jgi:hypothetical protein
MKIRRWLFADAAKAVLFAATVAFPILIGTVAAPCVFAQATNPTYLAEFPSVDKVMSGMKTAWHNCIRTPCKPRRRRIRSWEKEILDGQTSTKPSAGSISRRFRVEKKANADRVLLRTGALTRVPLICRPS